MQSVPIPSEYGNEANVILCDPHKGSVPRCLQPPAAFRIVWPGGRGKNGASAASVEEEEDEMSELQGRIRAANLPEHALKAAQKELKVERSMCMH